MGSMVALRKKYPHPNPQNLQILPYIAKHDQSKGLEKRHVSWIIQISPAFDHKGFSTRHTGEI